MKNILSILFLFIVHAVFADAPQLFRYQGRLVENNELVNANLPVSFKLYDSPSSGSLLYEDASVVNVTDGLYSTYIGDDTASGSISNALTAEVVYLEITINGQTLSPREQLVSVPFALNAGESEIPSGSIIMSTNYPDASIAELGYLPLQETGLVALDGSGMPAGELEPLFTFDDSLYFANETSSNLVRSLDGINFEEINISSNVLFMISEGEVHELNNQLIAIPDRPNPNSDYMSGMDGFDTAFSADGVTWNVYTNDLYGSAIDQSLAWDNHIYVKFITDQNYDTGIYRSSDGLVWSQVFSSTNFSLGAGSFRDVSMYYSDDYLFLTYDGMSYNNTNFYSSDGITWESVDGGNIEFSPDDDAFVNLNGVLWAVDDDNENDAMSGTNYEGALYKSLDGGITWVEVVELYNGSQPESVDTDPELYVADNRLWITAEIMGSLYTLSDEETLVRQINGSEGDQSFVSELSNGKVLIVIEYDDTDNPIIYSLGSSIKYSNGLYYYIKD